MPPRTKTGHEACAVLVTRDDGTAAWHPYCATCDKFGARCKDEAMAARVARAHEEGT